MNLTYFVTLLKVYAGIVLTLLCAVLITAMLVSAASAQERQAGLGVLYTHGSGTGNGDAIGVRADAVLPLNDFLKVIGEVSWAIEPKLYLGDGSGQTYRARVDLRAHWPGNKAVAPFVSVGGSGVYQHTSQYDKSAYNPTLGAGINVRNRVIPYWRHFFTEQQTQNKVAADEFGAELYLPLNGPRWLVRAGLAGVNTRFSQPPGYSNAGRYSVWTFVMHTGFALRF